MKIKRILITGDDGYNSIGTRALARLLKDKYTVTIAATLEQQSGVGGKISFNKKELRWGIEKVEGVDAYWIDGTPTDAIEFSQGYFKEKFDLVVSGINMGENPGVGIIASGTFCSAFRAIGVKITEKAIAMSYKCSPDLYRQNHNGIDCIEKFLEYPGKSALESINLCIENDFYGTNLLNINFPEKPTTKYKVTKLSTNITQYWFYPVKINKKKKTFYWRDSMHSEYTEKDLSLDIGALNQGYISITPINWI